LKARFEHYTVWTVERYIKTLDRYTSWAAQDKFHHGRHATVFGTFFRGPLKFFQSYVLHRGFLDGWAGLQVSLLSACYVIVKEAKLWEYEYALAQPDPEAQINLRLFDPGGASDQQELKAASEHRRAA
jgi:hypothetical protein